MRLLSKDNTKDVNIKQPPSAQHCLNINYSFLHIPVPSIFFRASKRIWKLGIFRFTGSNVLELIGDSFESITWLNRKKRSYLTDYQLIHSKSNANLGKIKVYFFNLMIVTAVIRGMARIIGRTCFVNSSKVFVYKGVKEFRKGNFSPFAQIFTFVFLVLVNINIYLTCS